jgi:hypothetical protein
LGRNGVLVSDLVTLAVALSVASGLWEKTVFPGVAWAAVALVWIAASTGVSAFFSNAWIGSRGLGTGRAVGLGLCVAASALTLKGLADPFSWREAGAFALMLAAALWGTRVALGLITRLGEADGGEGLRLGLAQCAAFLAVRPYARSGILGAGDANSYSLMIADVVAQWRAGIFPVLIGQSSFAFNGGFHPLRNAPYLAHLAWVLHLLSLGTLNVFALLNLTVVASMLGAVVGCYAALRISLPKNPWLALGLAVLFGLCPGGLAPLYGGDMYPTFMTLPFVPWFFLGVQRSSQSPEKGWPWVLQGTALAAMWMAHPPVAAWATLLAGLAALGVVVRERQWTGYRGMVPATGAFLALAGYLLVSVASLGLPQVTRADALSTLDYKMSVLHQSWANSLMPVSNDVGRLLGDVQLGYGLWACVLVAAWGASRERAGRTLLGCFALMIVFAWPIPGVTRLAWESLPTALLAVTNQWPVERFYVLLAGVAVFVSAPALGRLSSRGPTQRMAVAVLVLCACLWSAGEIRKFYGRAALIGASVQSSGNLLLPENITLSRTHSYEYLGTPSYFSNGHMDPRLETRLLDRTTRQPFADGATLRSDGSMGAPHVSPFVLEGAGSNAVPHTLQLDPGQPQVLRFDFLGNNPEGELQFVGDTLSDHYSLPLSGLSRSFGAGPQSSRSLILQNSTHVAEAVTIRFVAKGSMSGGAFARVTSEPLAEGARAIRLLSLTPFHAWVVADRNCFLETPKLFVPGYSARVDGAKVLLLKTAEGLVAVPLLKGSHDVSLTYDGGALLLLSYWGSACAWLALIVVVSSVAFRRMDAAGSDPGAVEPRFRWDGTLGVGRASACVAVVAAAAAGYWLLTKPSHTEGYGEVRMTVLLPWVVDGRSEPLVTTGSTGAGDCVYVTYLDGLHVLVGHDKWGYGGAKSAPIAVDPTVPQEIEINMVSMHRFGEGVAPGGSSGPGKNLTVTWNGVAVLTEDSGAYPSAPDHVTVGENRIGGSTALPRFSGEILKITRGAP